MPRATSAQTFSIGTLPAGASANSAVASLRPQERMTFDQVRLAAICDRHGDRAEAFLTTVLTDIETKTRYTDRVRDDAAALRGVCAEICSLAGMIGMMTMEQAARGVLDGLSRSDGNAAAACLARMSRLAQAESDAGWTLHDGPGTMA